MPDSDKKMDSLVVLGMHRSGTSVLTGCLHLLGVNLGHSLMPPAEGQNKAGFWENIDLVTVHDILLRDLGCNWNMVGALPVEWLESEAAEKARTSIRRLIEEHYLGQGMWAVKDPRMCRLMPLWLPILKEMGCTPAFVVTVRHPLEVARSLAKREKFSLRKGLLLWLTHNRDIFAACQGHVHTVHTYDQLLADPLRTLRGLERDLGISFPVPQEQVLPRLLDFVQPGLKTQHTAEQSEEGQRLCAPFVRLYEMIRATCLGSGQTGHPGVLPSSAAPVSGIRSVYYPTEDSPQFNAFSQPIPWDQLYNELLSFTGDQERTLNSRAAQKEQRLLSATSASGTLMAQVFFPQSTQPAYTEKHSQSFVLSPDQWQEIVCEIPNPPPLSTKGLRFDPMNTTGMVVIQSIKLTNKATGKAIFQADSPEGFEAVRPAGNALLLANQQPYTLVSLAHDPQLILPPLPNTPDCPLELRIWLKVSRNQEILRQEWERLSKERDALRESVQEQQLRAAQGAAESADAESDLPAAPA